MVQLLGYILSGPESNPARTPCLSIIEYLKDHSPLSVFSRSTKVTRCTTVLSPIWHPAQKQFVGRIVFSSKPSLRPYFPNTEFSVRLRWCVNPLCSLISQAALIVKIIVIEEEGKRGRGEEGIFDLVTSRGEYRLRSLHSGVVCKPASRQILKAHPGLRGSHTKSRSTSESISFCVSSKPRLATLLESQNVHRPPLSHRIGQYSDLQPKAGSVKLP